MKLPLLSLFLLAHGADAKRHKHRQLQTNGPVIVPPVAPPSPIPIDITALQSGPLLDNTAPHTGNAKCAIINIAMDESGSMETEQAFMIDDAVPGMLTKLYGTGYDYDHVFVCSNGFGWNYSDGPSFYQHLGCSMGNSDGTLQNPNILTWVSDGYWEEGYHALVYSIANVPQTIGGVNLQSDCGTLAKNIILVSDEDRDADFPATVEEMKGYIADNGYILNLVVDSTIDGTYQNVGFKSSADGLSNLVYQATDEYLGSYTTFHIDENFTSFVTHDASWAPDTSEHYIKLIVDEPGAVWNVKSLRDGTFNNAALRASFTEAFIDAKTEEITCPGGTMVNGVCTCPGGHLLHGTCTCDVPYINTGGECLCPPGTRPADGQCISSTESTLICIGAQVDLGGYCGCPQGTVDIGGGRCDVPPPPTPNIGGDPHITTFAGEHYEYHGGCDLVLVKDSGFMEDLGLNIHIRTKVVRYWSYIRSVAIKIGNEILEIEGAPENNVDSHYWINFEYQGELEDFAGFPVTQTLPNVDKRLYTIDLSSKYPGASIVIQLYKEFVKVKFEGATKELFGNTVGLLGEFETGKTLARDGVTVMHDFTEFGDEWQVLPHEPRIFHEIAHPQFPELCIKPEDARGDRKRRLEESSLTIDEAEAACAKALTNKLDIKDCVYDILATQDMGMVGAF